MADETRTQVYDVAIQAADALKTLAELKLQSQELKDQQKALGKVTEENAEQYYKLDSQIKATNTQAAAYQKQVTGSIKLQNAQGASLEKLRAQLALDNAEFAKLGTSISEAARKDELQTRIAATTEELKRQEQALGDYRRSVGDYAQATKSLSTELSELTQELMNMAAAGGMTSEAYKTMLARAGELKGAQDAVNQSLTNVGKGAEGVQALTGAVGAATAAYGLWTAAASLLGTENEELDRVMNQMMVVITALNSLTAINNALSKTNATYRAAELILQKVGINQTKQEAAALAAKSAMLGATTIGTKLMAAATWLWNAALAANPVMLVVIAIAALVAGIALLVSAFKSSSAESQAAAAAMNEYKKATEATAAAVAELERHELRRARENEIALRDEVAAIRARGGTVQEIAAAEYAATQKQYQLDMTFGIAKLAQYQLEYAAASRAVQAKQAEIDTWTGSIKKLKEAQEEMATLREEAAKLYDTINTTAYNIRKSGQDAVTASQDHSVAVKKFSADAASAGQAAADKVLQAWINTSQQLQRIAEETLKLQNTYQSDSISARQKFDTELFAIQQKGERERLDAQRKGGKITATEYANSYKLLELQADQFNQNQLKALNDYYTEARKSIVSLAGRTVEEQIGEVTAKYTKAIQGLADIQTPVRIPGMTDEEYSTAMAEYEAYLYGRVELETRLEKTLAADIAALRKADLDKRISVIDAALTAQYGEDLARYQDNEREKLKIHEAMLREQIARYREAGKATGELEAQLRANGLAKAKLDMDTAVNLAGESARQQYEARYAYLTAELTLVQGNADAEIEIMAQMQELKRTYWEEQIGRIGEYAQKVTAIVTAITELVNQNSEAQKQKVVLQYKDEAQALADKYATGLLTEAQYNAETLRMERKKDKELAKIELEEAKRNKALQIFQAVVGTALAVVQALNAPPPVSFIFAALAGAMGALQIATIASTPLPEAEQGMYITGPRHAGGGVAIEAEGGEVIINRRSASMFLPLLSAINEMGGGVPFTDVGADGGYANRSAMASTSGITRDEVTGAIQEAFSQVTVIATIEDIRRAEHDYADIASGGTIL